MINLTKEALPETVKKIEHEKSADEIIISDMQGQIFYCNGLKNNEWTRTPEATKTLEKVSKPYHRRKSQN